MLVVPRLAPMPKILGLYTLPPPATAAASSRKIAKFEGHAMPPDHGLDRVTAPRD